MEGIFKQYAWLLNVVFVLCLAYFVAKIVNVYVASLLEISRSIAVVTKEEKVELASAVGSMSDYEGIAQRNIFDASEEPGPAPCEPEDPRPECQPQGDSEPPPIPTGEAVKTALKIKVLSIMMVGDGTDARSSSSIDNGKGTPGVFVVNDEKVTFLPGTVLKRIKPRRIEFINQGRLEYAELEALLGSSIFVSPEKLAKVGVEKGPATAATGGVPTGQEINQTGEGKFVINQAEIDAALSTLDRLYTEIRAVPNFEGGQVKGMKILSIKPGSLFAKLGLMRGDVLDQINGSKIDIKEGFKLFTQLKEQKQFRLDLIRNGKTQSFEYEVR